MRQQVGDGRRWAMLAAGFLAQTSGALVVHGTAFLIPALRADHGFSLARAGALVALPTAGMVLTLIGWGALTDRFGERRILAVGLTLTATFAAAAALSPGMLTFGGFLLLAGATAASTNAASGRVVVGWFPAERRGLVMGIRQMAQPAGVGLGALTIPRLAGAHGIFGALWLPAALAGVTAIVAWWVVIDPPRPDRATASPEQLANPYRAGGLLWRIHGVSMLLVVPQFAVWTYALVWLISDRGLSVELAGVLVTASQILGALGRIGVGHWSDRVGSRLRPLRTVALASAGAMLALAATDWAGWSLAIGVMMAATVISVADNGLAFTSVAEIGGPYWSGRALGAQNTGQFLAAAAVPPVLGLLIGTFGYPATFALTALCPIAAAPLVPRTDRANVGLENREP